MDQPLPHNNLQWLNVVCIHVWVHLVIVYSQTQIDPNSLFCYIPNKGAPIAFSILYGISAVAHWYQCWYVHALSACLLIAPAWPGLMPCATISTTHHYPIGGIRLNIRFLWVSVLPSRPVGSSTSHPLFVRFNRPHSRLRLQSLGLARHRQPWSMDSFDRSSLRRTTHLCRSGLLYFRQNPSLRAQLCAYEPP